MKSWKNKIFKKRGENENFEKKNPEKQKIRRKKQ